MAALCLSNIGHTDVYRRYLNLAAGTQYIWETRNLRSRIPWKNADTYMYLVKDTTIVAKNDDFNGLASLIAYVPSASGTYYLIIRAYSKYSLGECDVYQSVGGGSAQKIDDDVKFGGYPISAHWKADERILTRNATGDTYLYLIHGNTMLRDDDSGTGLCSSLRPGYEGYGLAVVGSYSAYSEGTTVLCNYYQSYLDNPGARGSEDKPQILVSENMHKFTIELLKEKPNLEKLSHKEREEKIRKLRDSILSKKDLSLLSAPEISVSKEYTAAAKKYEGLLKTKEKELKALSVPERAMEMAKIEQTKRAMMRDLVPQEEEWSTPH